VSVDQLAAELIDSAFLKCTDLIEETKVDCSATAIRETSLTNDDGVNCSINVLQKSHDVMTAIDSLTLRSKKKKRHHGHKHKRLMKQNSHHCGDLNSLKPGEVQGDDILFPLMKKEVQG